jgi:hypothetical protein
MTRPTTNLAIFRKNNLTIFPIQSCEVDEIYTRVFKPNFLPLFNGIIYRLLTVV